MTRIAIAHDYLTQRGGAERVVLAMARAFPEAPIYTTLFDPDGTYPEFRALDVRPSWLNRIGPLRRHHRAALPLLPWASSSTMIDADVVVASSSGWSHGFRTTGRKLVYCYSPARWIYDPERYLGVNAPAMTRGALRLLTPTLRRWDRRAARSADAYLAISTVTQSRIQRAYGRDAPVVPAPHSIATGGGPSGMVVAGLPSESYFLVVSRLLPYKNVLPVVQTFVSRPDLRLVIVGAGPQKQELLRCASPNVYFLEGLTDTHMQAVYTRCTALIAASHEDFGLTPLEAAAYGKPSAVLRGGGFLDTVVEGATGFFFDAPDPAEIGDALDRIRDASWDPAVLRARADDFSEEVFAQSLRREVDRLDPSARHEVE